MFSVQKFERNFEELSLEDMGSCPYSFCRFWNWKVRIESRNLHILDPNNVDEAFNLLSPTLRRWRWSRPHRHQKLASKLLNALKNVERNYKQIRTSSLLDFDQIPVVPLRLIWDELGKVKPPKGGSIGENLIMAVTKPLMFLWGQTPAFDSQVRANMDELKLPALSKDRWTFEDWYTTMTSLQETMKMDPHFAKHLKAISEREYGTSSPVPYGRFLDAYYYYK